MLDGLRKGANTLPVKLLLLLIVISFAVWGVGDIFRSTPDDTVARIGNQNTVTLNELNHRVQLETARLQRMLGNGFSVEQLAALHMREVVLNQLVNGRLMTMAADALSLRVGNGTIIDTIRAMPVFMDAEKHFSKQRFNEVLHGSGTSEALYIASLKQDIATGFLVDTLLLRSPAPEGLAKLLYRFRTETRRVDILTLPADYVKTVPAPSEAEVSGFYARHKQDFSAPEQRRFSYLTLGPEDLANAIVLSEDALKQAYDENLAEYRVAERRDVDNLVFTDEAPAQEAWKLLKGGSHFAAVARKFQGKAARTPLAGITRDTLPKEAQDSVFALKTGAFTPPVQSALGWHIFHVTAIMPASVTPFEEVRAALSEALTRKKAEAALYNLANKLEDALASGSTLDEIARKFSLARHSVASLVDAEGKTEDGTSADLPAYPNLLQTAFATAEGTESSLVLTPDNGHYFLLHVDKVLPAHVRPLAEVRPRVIRLWTEARQAEASAALARAVQERVKSGKSLAEEAALSHLAPEIGRVVSRAAPLVYGKQEDALPAALLEEIFTLKKMAGPATGAAVTSVHTQPGKSYRFAVLREVIPAALPDAETPAYRTIQNELREGAASDLSEQYLRYLRSRYPVVVRSEMLVPKEKEAE